MKKLFALTLVLAVLVSAFAAAESAAGGTAQTAGSSNAYAEYEQKGYTWESVSVSSDDGVTFVLQVFMNSADRTDCVLVEAALTDEECAELEALDFFDDQYSENQWKIVTALPADRITVTSLNDRIPSAEETARYAGMTVSALMDDGFEWATNAEDGEGAEIMIFSNGDTGVMYAVTLAGDPDPEELSDELIGSQVIETVRFWGFAG